MTAGRPTPPPLGQMLVRKGLVSEADLRQALRIHEETRRPLGEILVDAGAISVTALADALLVQDAWRPLGRMLVDKGLLSEGDLAEALTEQARSGRPLGEVVRTKFFLSASQIGDVIAEQHALELEMDHGFGSGLRRGIDRRQHGGSSGAGERPSDGDEAGPLARRIESNRDGDRLAVLQAALEDSEETVSTLGLANRQRRDEVADLRAQIAEQANLIDALRARLAELEPAPPANGAVAQP